jgi:hypothetical protein
LQRYLWLPEGRRMECPHAISPYTLHSTPEPQEPLWIRVCFAMSRIDPGFLSLSRITIHKRCREPLKVCAMVACKFQGNANVKRSGSDRKTHSRCSTRTAVYSTRHDMMTGCTSSQQLRPHASYLSAMLFEEKLNVQDKTAACTR